MRPHALPDPAGPSRALLDAARGSLDTAVTCLDEDEEREARWSELRTAYLRERIARGGAASDYVALVRALGKAYSAGRAASMDEPYAIITEAARRFPRSASVLEHKLQIELLTARNEAADSTVAALERVDPSSAVLATLREITPASQEQWVKDVNATQWSLLQGSQSSDPAAADRAVHELGRWMRAYPANSTYAVNYGLALLGRGRTEEALEVARATVAIEDGSFADAYNLAVIMWRTGAEGEAATMFQAAAARATSPDEHDLVVEAVGRRDG